MCTRFYVEPISSCHNLIEKAQRMAHANDIMVKLGKNLAMTDEIRPTDVAAVLAPNKEGKMLVFPMLWGLWVDGYNTPIMNCHFETTDSKPLWKDSWFRRRCVILASWYYEWSILARPMANVIKPATSTTFSRKAAIIPIWQEYTALRSMVDCKCLCSLSSQGHQANW